MQITTGHTQEANQPVGRTLATSIGKNTLFGIVSGIFQIGTRFITVPIVISHLGLGGFGIWSIVMNVAAYMRFGSIGVKSAFQKYVAEATATGDYDRASRLLSTGCAGMLAISIVGLIPIAVLSRKLALAAGFPQELLTSGARSISILAITMVIANAGAAYEAIVMGGHRIDLARKFNTYLCVAEALAIILALHVGYGLVAMASVMAASELVFILCCARASRHVAPHIRLAPYYVTRTVMPELVRFAGSYQLVSLLQIIYGAIVPVAVLRAFGANASGIVAIASRLMSPVGMCQSAFLVPVLSGGAMIYATGSSQRMHALLMKSFKVTLATTLIPLALIAAFGNYAIEAWTGQSDPRFVGLVWLMALSGLFQGVSLLGLVLYRASGKTVLDNIREASRIGVALVVALVASRIGIYGVFLGLAMAELSGAVVMAFAMLHTFPTVRPSAVLLDVLRLSAATIGIVVVSKLAVGALSPVHFDGRSVAALKVGAVCVASLLSAYPALHLTGSISRSEVLSILDAFRRKTGTSAQVG